MEFDLPHTDALLSTTRAVRKRLDLDREVPDEVILECLQLAVQAPTGSNRQGWRWMVVNIFTNKFFCSIIPFLLIVFAISILSISF